MGNENIYVQCVMMWMEWLWDGKEFLKTCELRTCLNAGVDFVVGILRGSLWDQWRGRTVPWKSLFVDSWWIGGIGLWCPVLLLSLASQSFYYRQCVELIQVHCDQRPLVSVIIFCFVITSSAIRWSEHPNQKGIVCSFLSGECCCGWKCREKQHEVRRCESCIVHCGEEGWGGSRWAH